MKIRYYLPRENTKKSNIMMSISWHGNRIRISTGYSIQVKDWDIKHQRSKSSFKHAISLNNYLDRLNTDIVNAYLLEKNNQDNTSKENIEKIVKKILKPESKKGKGFIDQYKEFIKMREESNQLSFRTIQRYRTALNHIMDFENKVGFRCNFDNMDSEFYNKFRQFLQEKKNLKDNSVGSIVKTLKIFLNWSVDEGLNLNIKFVKQLKVISKRSYKVALTKKELKKIAKVKLSSKRLDEIRDIFLLICYTCLRYSDIYNLNKYNFDFENNVLRSNQEKKEEIIEIPIHNKVRTLFKKYEKTNFPKISLQKFNDLIKVVFKEAKFDEPVEMVSYYGQKTIKEVFPKYELISSNTARRTFITLALKEKALPENVMNISGHSDRKAFQYYVNISKQESLKEIANIFDKM